MKRADRILEDARREADNEDFGITNGLDNATLTPWLNDAQDRIQNLVSAAYVDFLKTVYEFNTQVGVQDYTIQGFRLYLDTRVRLVEFSVTGLNKDYRPLKKGTIYSSDESQGQPNRYIRQNDIIRLNQIPNSTSYKVRVTFEKEADDLDVRRGRITSMTGPLAEVFTVQCNETTGSFHRWRLRVDDVQAAIVENSYFLVPSPHTTFYCWFNKGTGTDPNVAGATGIELDISGDVSAENVSTTIHNTLNAVRDLTSSNVGVALFDIFAELDWNGPTELDFATADAHLTRTTTTQGSGNPFLERFESGQYFLFNSVTTGYYAWLNVEGRGTDPAVVGRTGVEIALEGDDIASVCATKMAAAIDALSEFTSTATTDTVTVTAIATGVTGDPDRGNISESSESDQLPAMTLVVTQQGTQIDQINLADTTPVPDPELDNVDVGDYISIVDKDGVVKVNGMMAKSGSDTIGAANIGVEHSLSSSENPNVGDYVVFGKYTTTHSELPDAFETYLRKYVAWKMLEKDGSTDISQRFGNQVRQKEKELVDAYASLGTELIEIPLLGDDEFYYEL